MSCITKWALMEPLVDVVEGESVATTPYIFKSIDIKTVKKEDLAFVSEFSLETTRSDYIHAFLGYFDITFSACHKPVYFSTGPADRYTHWKQTVFYLKDDIVTSKGDVIKGRLSCRPNGKNPRDLDISIEYTHQSADGKDLSSDKLDYLMC